ncbi:MAG: phosphotransferase [Chloroflexota bacterium]|nr:phosphotransferase [Chloroflexota bacterium]
MSLPDAVIRRVTRLLREYAGTHVNISRIQPVTEGWSAQFGAWPWVTRCTIEGGTGAVPASVIVKMRRPEFHVRSEPERLHNERAALEFLTLVGSAVGPRLLAADDEAGILVMEDLGTGPALEDLLLGSDSAAAEHGFVAFAGTLGRMHATTAGHAAEYYQLRSRLGPLDPAFERTCILGNDIEGSWRQVREIVADRPYLPPTSAVCSDVDELLRVLSEPGPYLAFSNGDTCPANCRMSEGGVRFIDFEEASFRHALLDAAALRFPFPACPCWSRLPEDVSLRAETAYRNEMARSCPDVLDDASYAHGLTVACAAWTIVRAVRLPKLEKTDEPHPMGFSRRGQFLDIIGTAVSCSQQSSSLHSLACWLSDVSDALRERWPHITSTQPLYPAFQPRNSS